MSVRVYIMGESAFVDIGKGYLLCIGSKTEVDEAKDQTRILEMVEEAIAHSKWRDIAMSKGLRVH